MTDWVGPLILSGLPQSDWKQTGHRGSQSECYPRLWSGSSVTLVEGLDALSGERETHE